MIKLTSFDAPSAEETATIEKVQDKFKEAEVFADQKMAWTERGCLLVRLIYIIVYLLRQLD